MQSPPFLVKNAYLRLIDVFCDSFEKIILKKGSYCQVNREYSGTSMLLHLCCFYWAPWSKSFPLFSSSVWETVRLPKHLGDWSKCCNERYFLRVAKCIRRWIFWTWSMKLRTWCICLPLSLLLLRLLCGLSLMVGRLQLTGNTRAQAHHSLMRNSCGESALDDTLAVKLSVIMCLCFQPGYLEMELCFF